MSYGMFYKLGLAETLYRLRQLEEKALERVKASWHDDPKRDRRIARLFKIKTLRDRVKSEAK